MPFVATTFVGRGRELEILRAAVVDAQAGRGRLVLIAGEAGVGKTRLAQEIGGAAEAGGFEVLWGRGWDGGGATAFWPWIQVMRAYARPRTDEELRRSLFAIAADLARAIPSLRERLPELPAPPPLETEEERFRFFDSFNSFLHRAGEQRPLLVVLDDLHCIDPVSLLLLQFVVPELEHARVAIVGTYRDEEVPRSQSLSRSLSELRRGPFTRELTLAGLAAGEIAELITATAGRAADDDLVQAIERQTDGNPFFVGEVTRLLLATGSFDAVAGDPAFRVPASVQAAVARRLDHLSGDCRELLDTAAVIGRDFSIDVLAAAAELTHERALELIDQAITARIVASNEMAGSFRFVHALIRETLYGRMPTVHRLRLHQKVGRVLETMYADQLPASLSEESMPSRGEFPSPRGAEILPQLAHHYGEASTLGDADKAVLYGRHAAACAIANFAYEDARSHCERTLRIVEQSVPIDERARCALLLTLSGAQTRTSDFSEARATALSAAQSARRVGDTTLLGRTALALPGQDLTFDEASVAILDEALADLGPEDSALTARILGRLGHMLRWSADLERGAALRLAGVEMARRTGDQRARAETLWAYTQIGRPDDLEAQFAAAAEILQLGEAMDNHLLTYSGLQVRASLFMTTGDLTRAYEDHEAQERIHFAPRRAVHWVGAMRALLEGRFDDAERIANDAFVTAQRVGSLNAAAIHAGQMYQLYRERGQLEELAQMAAMASSQFSRAPTTRCSLAALYAALGSTREAEELFREFASCGFTELPRDSTWLAGMGLLVETCAFLRDADAAAQLYDLLGPFAHLNIVLGSSAVCAGSVSHYLGLLAATLRRWADAESHFERALRANARLKARPAIARTQQGYAAMLIERDRGGDRERALELLGEAITTAETLGMKALLERARELTAAAKNAGTGKTTEVAGRPAGGKTSGAHAVLRREGDYWTIAHGGATSRLKDARGLQYLAHLLRHPGQDFHALDLMRQFSPGADPMVNPGPRSASGAKLEMLDATAKAAYRQRLSELRAEITESEQFNDPGRNERLRVEMEALTEQLAAAVGLGGRDREAASATERARSTVTQRIRAAVRRIGDNAPLLADHLSSRISTGTYCVYHPDLARPIVWLLD